MKIVIFQSILVACFLGGIAHAGLWKAAANFDECVTDLMKGVKGDEAAEKVEATCRAQFPDDKQEAPPSRFLSLAELALLTGRGGLTAENGNYLAGNIYNGNQEGTVKALTIFIMPKVPSESFQGMKKKLDAMEAAAKKRRRQSPPVMMPFDDVARKKKETEGHIRYYHLAIEIPPLTIKNFSVQVLESDAASDGYEWGIAEAEVN